MVKKIVQVEIKLNVKLINLIKNMINVLMKLKKSEKI